MNSMNKLGFTFAGLIAVLAPSLSGCQGGSATNTTNPTMNGIDGPHVTLTADKFSMWVILNQISFDGGLSYVPPQMPHSDISATPDLNSGGLLLEIDIAIADVTALVGANTIPPQTLPGGRALPGVGGGEIPALAITVPKWDNTTIYFGPSVFGVFIPVKMGLPNFIGTFRFFDQSGKDVGNLSVVGEDSQNKNSGFLVLIPLQLSNGVLSPGTLN